MGTKETLITLDEWIKKGPSLSDKLIALLDLYRKLQKNQDMYKRVRVLPSEIWISNEKIYLSSNYITKTSNTIREREYLYQTLTSLIPITINFLAYMIKGSITNYKELMKEDPVLRDKKGALYAFMANSVSRHAQMTSKEFQERLKERILEEKKSESQPSFGSAISPAVSAVISKLTSIIREIEENRHNPQSIINEMGRITEGELQSEWRVMNAQGVIYQKLGMVKQAYEMYNKALLRSKRHDLVLNNLASLDLLRKQYYFYAESLIEMQKKKWTLSLASYYANALALTKKYPQAIGQFQRIIKEVPFPQNIEYHMKVAEIYFMQKEYEKSQAKYQLLLETIENYKNTGAFNRTNQGSTRVSSISPQLFLQIERWTQIIKLNIVVAKRQAKLLSSQGALKEIKNIHKEHLHSKQVLYAYATSLAQNNQFLEAIRLYTQIRGDHRGNPEYLWNIAKCFYETDNKECFIYFKELKLLDPSRASSINKTILDIDSYFESLDKLKKKELTSSLNSADGDRIKEIVREASEEYNQ